MTKGKPNPPPKAPASGADLYQKLNALLHRLRNTSPAELLPADFDQTLELAGQLPLTPLELGTVNQALLIPQIWRAAHTDTRRYPLIFELCRQYESTPGASVAHPDDRCFIHISYARAHLASALDTTLSEDRRREALNDARSRLSLAARLVRQYSLLEGGTSVEEHTKILSGIETRAIKTILRFDLPFALNVPDGIYQIALPDGSLAELNIVYQPPTATRFGYSWDHLSTALVFNVSHEKPDAMPDPVGNDMARVQSLVSSRTLLGFSALRLVLPYFIDVYGELPPPEDLEQWPVEPIDPLILYQFPKEFQQAVRITNHFIDHVRSASRRYEIDRVTAADIECIGTSTEVAGIRFMQLPFRGSGPYRVTRGTVDEPAWLNQLRSALAKASTVDAVTRLILDAQKHLLQGDLRLAILNINAAFEMFVNTHFWERLRGRCPERDLREFIEGESIFETCRDALIEWSHAGGGKEYGVAADLLPTPPLTPDQRHSPSVYKIVKRMNQIAPFGMSWGKLSKLLNQIRKNRNEVAHGVVDDASLDPEQVARSLQALTEFIELAKRTATQS